MKNTKRNVMLALHKNIHKILLWGHVANMVVQQSIFGVESDAKHMRYALEMAGRALDADEVPIGAVIVDAAQNVIGRGWNQIEGMRTQTAHAEMIALQQASTQRRDWRLQGCWLYVTLEPCIMCISCICLSRLTGVVYGASSPLFGTSHEQLFLPPIYRQHNVLLVKAVESEAAAILLKQFFKKQRGNAGEQEKFGFNKE
jgi:tRNA(adenine34) deaminase